jgi:alkylation response protein AidB-like acyl-CoA dehydrogenase
MRSFSEPAAEAFRSEVREWLIKATSDVRATGSGIQADLDAELQLRRDWDRKLANAGYAALTWPVEYGGRGFDAIEEVIFAEESAAAHAPIPINQFGRRTPASAIMEYGTPQQRARFLPPILSGDEIWCEGFSEPDAGSDLAAVATTAVRETDGYRIIGTKVWTSLAHIADRCYLLARTSDDAPRHHNVSVFLLNMKQPEVRVIPIKQITGASEFSRVTFDGVWAGDDELLGVENEGWPLASLVGLRTMNQLSLATRYYVTIRDNFDQLRECCNAAPECTRRVDRIGVKVELLRWHVMRTTEMKMIGREWQSPSSVLHLYWAELWQEITQLGLEQMCVDHEKYWRRWYFESRAATIFAGTAQIQRNVIAERILGLPR